jgi:hypothetical protein
MYPYVIKLGNLSINPLWIGIFVFFLVFIYSVWHLQKGKTKESKIFDIAFFSIIFAGIFNRIIVVIANYDEYLIQGWNVLPFREYFDPVLGNQIHWLTGLPWSAVVIVPGKSAFIAIFFGILIGLLVFFMNSKKFKKIYEVLDDVAISYALAALPLLIAMHYAGAYVGKEAAGFMSFQFADGVGRYSLQLLQVMYFVGFLVLVYILKYRRHVERTGLFSAIFLLLHGLAELLIRYLSAGYEPTILNTFDYYQLLCLILVLLGLFLIFSIWQEYGQTASVERKQIGDSAFRNVGAAGGKERFNMSFAKFRTSNSVSTNSFTRYTNTIKRKFKSQKAPENETE